MNTDAIDKLLKADLETMNSREIADLMLGNQTDALAQLEALKARVSELEQLMGSQYPDADWEEAHLKLEEELRGRIHELERPWQPIETCPVSMNMASDLLFLEDEGIISSGIKYDDGRIYNTMATRELHPTHWAYMPLPALPESEE